MRLLLSVLTLLVACHPAGESKTDTQSLDSQGSQGMDGDGDGWSPEAGDCVDDNAAIHPDAQEQCNGLDDNCDGSTDEGVELTFYADTDGDGYGDAQQSQLACAQPEGFVALSSDCNDNNAEIYPGAPERCNLIDDDCDTEVDEAVTNTWYYDADLDGYGDINSILNDCDPPTGYVANSEDCDDSSAAAFPGNPEVCDTQDNDCNGLTDDGVTTPWYADTDGDGFGNAALIQEACAQPEGYSGLGNDCEDGNAAVYPGASEYCNGVDDDCDTEVDEADALDAGLWYADTDGDGFGDTHTSLSSCDQPVAYVADQTDCDDQQAAVYPNAPEFCNGQDDNCDGQIDEETASDALDWYADGDGDGFGDVRVQTVACTQPAGFVADATDCNDGAAQAHPGAAEICDLLDNDCDGTIDSGAIDAAVWYADRDSDSFGDPALPTFSCSQPAGYAANALDCNDASLQDYPGAPEFCDNRDNNCDGQVDESAVDAATWYADRDQDGYGDITSSLENCTQPAGFVADTTDCDDGQVTVHPLAPEICDGFDNDCDGRVDVDAIDATIWSLDADADGFGSDRIWTVSCTQPLGYILDGTDCNDVDRDIYPGADEFCDGQDNNCDGRIDEATALDVSQWYQDQDSDAFGNATVSQWACTAPLGYVADPTDCDDRSASTFPGAAPEDSLTACMKDSDGDDYGDDSTSGAVIPGSDCDDTAPTIYLGAPEDGGTGHSTGDQLDNDCDSYVDEGLLYGSGADGALSLSSDSDLGNYGATCEVVSAIGSQTATIQDVSAFSIGDKVLLLNLQSSNYLGNWELLDVAAINGHTLQFVDPISRRYGAANNSNLSGEVVALFRVPQYTSVSVPSGVRLSAGAWDGACGGVVAFLATETLQVDGTIDGNNLGYVGGTRNTSYQSTGQSGEGGTGLGSKTYRHNQGGGGGGGLAVTTCPNCEGNGGGGGHAALGEDGQQSNPTLGYGGEGGYAYGGSTLSTLSFGSGGGAGALDTVAENGIGGSGGDGGGIILIHAYQTTLNGSIQAAGEDGEIGCAQFSNWCGTANSSNPSEAEAGGAGAGGSLYLVSDQLTGNGQLSAVGGLGQLSGSSWARYSGDGSEGYVRLDVNWLNGNAVNTAAAVSNAASLSAPDPYLAAP